MTVKRIWIIVLLIAFFAGCDQFNGEVDFYPEVMSDTLDLAMGDCEETIGKMVVCLDSVLEDSRCPAGAVCVWEGNAGIRLLVTDPDEVMHKIELNTFAAFNADTILQDIEIKLVEVMPYPQFDQATKQQDYAVRLFLQWMTDSVN